MIMYYLFVHYCLNNLFIARYKSCLVIGNLSLLLIVVNLLQILAGVLKMLLLFMYVIHYIILVV